MTMTESVSDFVVHRFGDEPSDDANVRVWFANLDEQHTDAAQLSWLSTSEHVRASRLKSLLERQRYLAGRVFTRRVLSNLTNIAPEDLKIIADQCGKPRLSLPAVEGRVPSNTLLKFNVSHSKNFLCIATALGRDIGIDIEVVNPNLDFLAISQACLDREDNEQVRCSSPHERGLVFHRLWTRKEAFAKMRGHGVTSNHVHRMLSVSWSLALLEFTLGEKQVVGALAISA